MIKEQTLEEAAERLYPENWESIMDGQHDSNSYERTAFINGAKWQQERNYSEEEVLDLFVGILDANKCFVTFKDIKEWFEQNKKK